jgi:hypothetical protein
MFKHSILLFMSIWLLQACGTNELEAPSILGNAKPVPANWQQAQSQRITDKNDYLNKHKIAYDWFSKFAFSETDGDPLIIIKLLPIIAPEFWGSKDNFLDVVGLFNDPDTPNYPVPTGIGISGLARDKPFSNIDYTSFTCAACHIGRVRNKDGALSLIEGGVNSEFNIVQYRVRVYKTLMKIIGTETDSNKQNTLLVKAFSQALVVTHENNENYFYDNYSSEYTKFDSEYERKQIELFQKNADQTIIEFSSKSIQNYKGYAALLNKNYKSIFNESIIGFPGMADATGISTINGYNGLKGSIFTGWFADIILPSSPGITDFMSVWEQDKRKASWDKDHKTLINGGGQWNGNIPIPMYRNLAAQLTLGLKDNDIRVAAFGVELLDGLPASVYPFKVDVQLANKGKKLFEDNCLQCHQPFNGKVYENLGTNLDRTHVVNWLIRKGGIDNFYGQCSPTTSVDMEGTQQNPCAEFDGVSLKDKKQLIMSANADHYGYNARPLSGIWAQAPYLHNGSVPTLYHLLMPNERPASFEKSRLDYDENLVGFAWEKNDDNKEGYKFETKSFAAFSNKGHDEDIKEGDNTYKLDWSDDKESVMALIEYMKVL